VSVSAVNPVVTVIGTLLGAVSAVRRLFEQVRSKNKDGLSAALEGVLAAHKAIPAWMLREEDRPAKTLATGEYLRILDQPGSGLRLAAVLKSHDRILERVHDNQLLTVSRKLLANQDQPWCAALVAGFLVAEEYGSKQSISSWNIGGELRVRAAFHDEYLQRGGAADVAAAVADIALQLFLDDGLVGAAGITADLCRRLETVTSDPNSLLQTDMMQSASAVERDTGLLVKYLATLIEPAPGGPKPEQQ